MKIINLTSALYITSSPIVFWLFYSFFFLGGLVCVWLAQTQASGTERVAGLVIGFVNVVAGLWLIFREPGSVVSFNKTNKEVLVKRWHPFFQKTKLISFDDIITVDVETEEASEGGNVYRPRLSLVDGSYVPISMSWYQKSKPSESVVIAIQNFISLPSDI